MVSYLTHDPLKGKHIKKKVQIPVQGVARKDHIVERDTRSSLLLRSESEIAQRRDPMAGLSVEEKRKTLNPNQPYDT